MVANGRNMSQPKSDHVRPSFLRRSVPWRLCLRLEMSCELCLNRKHRWNFASDCLGKCPKPFQCMPTSQELAVLCQKYSSALGIRIFQSHQWLGYDALWPFDGWGGDMRELLTSGSSDTVQAVYEAIEPQTPLGFVRFSTSMKNQVSQHWSHEHVLRWAVFVEMASIHENMQLDAHQPIHSRPFHTLGLRYGQKYMTLQDWRSLECTN